MTAVLDRQSDTSPATAVADPLAAWLKRVGAFAVDVLMPLGVAATIALVAQATTQGSWLWWLAVSAIGVVILLTAANRLLVPVLTGWSVGRALVGIRVVHRTGEAVGPWRLLARDVAHLLDTLALFIGWLWPLWDSRNRTFADLLVRTEVRRVAERPANARRVTAGVLIGAAVLSLVAAGLSYLVVYRQDHAVEQARREISGQGPKIVAEMLSYSADSLQKDFAHAQSLTTDAYRPQLVAQQDAVKKAVPTTNEYWAANSAVLSASPDRAVMLMMLQGQRTASQQPQHFITATVRVSFEKSRQGQWRVADLTVLTKPHANEAPK
ncbi:MAG: RDD family protein [Mycobacteriaceae bacterium]|nr:RDD family protein [Mycobacteriaceae bacterium]